MIAVAVSFYIVGLLVFHVWGQLDDGWYEVYYIWDKAKDVLLTKGLHLVSPPQYKDGLLCVVIFSLIRFLWQIISYFTGANINNTEVIGWLFIMLAFIAFLMMLKGFVKWHK